MAAVYRIGTAARLSGIDVMTLRNWERRYGVVTAIRSAGKQRLYSLADIERLRWLRERVESGLSPAEAHALLRELQAQPGERGQTAFAVRDAARQARAAAAATRARVQADREAAKRRGPQANMGRQRARATNPPVP